MAQADEVNTGDELSVYFCTAKQEEVPFIVPMAPMIRLPYLFHIYSPLSSQRLLCEILFNNFLSKLSLFINCNCKVMLQ